MSELNIEELRNLITDGQVVDPLVFLEATMGGSDPRERSQLHTLINDLNDFYGPDTPDKEDWQAVVDMVNENYVYMDVSMNQSLNSAKILAEYLHPKRKNVEITGDSIGNSLKSEPLTAEEIRLFKVRFNGNF